MGYGESKYVAELLLEAGAEKSGVPTVICRVGQLAGPVTKKGGMWNKQEWLPSVSSLQPSSPYTSSIRAPPCGVYNRKRGYAGLVFISTTSCAVDIPKPLGHRELEIPRQDPHGSPKYGHGILGPRRHHRPHHRRPRPRQRLTRPITESRPPLQPRQPLPGRLALPRPSSDSIFPTRRQEQQLLHHHRTRPLRRLALRPPGFRGLGHRRRREEPGHQIAGFLHGHERRRRRG